ncbi:tyrosine-type recombinase/integrase [Parafrankia sp. EUN1f]|uniref:tyrosine-type recombinase/integrase n=1 Tax=Parafrankia sp. EUN1f TaxID=102897 RepID=UPI0001C462F1|nr:tyrosine-type recombinase/integrase [Parafrankia sp. EUN1f]EFC82251.1 integrase family protein [Parafrankia sp. EUN1f]
MGHGSGGSPSGAAGLYLVDGVPLLRPDEQVFAAMLDGWRDQQLARNLSVSTVDKRLGVVRMFTAHADAFPWVWRPQMLDEWLSDLRAVRGRSRSTIRNYSLAVSAFCRYLLDPAYGWPARCEHQFGSHPVQICHEWNTAVHVQDTEADPSRRAFTLTELQTLFDYADDQVAHARAAGRKGWLSLFRDATLFKVAYSYGLRRREVVMLDLTDFATNPHAAEFGTFGVCRVRFGKAMKGSAPKPRSVLTVWPWTPDILTQWVDELRPLMPTAADSPALWPSERAGRITLSAVNRRLTEYRNALGLPAGLDVHSLRRSYVTHLIEDGWDPLFVQQQVGHEHASTTAIYTCVSSDFRTRTLRSALDATMRAAIGPGGARP